MKKDISRTTILGKTPSPIAYREALDEQYIIVDVRSAGEYENGTMPGAVNIPLFDEDERSVIGTIYKHGGQARAVEQGFSYVEEKLGELLQAFEPYRQRTVAVFCARGGMRSRSVVNLLLQSGYRACQIEGGYKKYRHDVLEVLGNFRPRLIVLHGLTGTGKTRLIQGLENSIDLEELAQHRSSLFGAIDKEPNSQRTFETLLSELALQMDSEPYFVEGESRKIGRVFIPKPFAMAMKEAVLVNITCSIETRIKRIIEDYPVDSAKKRGEILQILLTLKQNMGAAVVDKMCDLFARNELDELVRILLVDYYDKRYARSMSKYTFDFEVSSENISEAIDILMEYRLSLLS